MSRTIGKLLNYLDSRSQKAPLGELMHEVGQCDVGLEDVAEFLTFSNERYTRNLVKEGTHYRLLVLCWKNGQCSPPHDHAGSNCAVRVVHGLATETLFEPMPGGLARPTGRPRILTPGRVFGSADTDIHVVANLQTDGADQVTLHVYSPPLVHMNVYQLYNPSDDPRHLELAADGAA